MNKIGLIASISILLLGSIVFANTRVVAETSYSKAVNWNSGCELLIKGTTNLNDTIDLKYGVSEQFDGERSSPFSLNHGARRFDIGFLAKINQYVQVGYTHSERIPFDGANEESIYLNKSLDTATIRWEVNID